MILAGIDEAGYGPLLGPLVIGCAAFELPDGDDPTVIPNAWALLRRAVGKTRDPKGKRLHVNDSKKVYTPAIGLAELERSVLCLVATCHGDPACLDSLLGLCAAESCEDLRAAAWYRRADDEAFPVMHEAVSIRLATNHLRHELARANIRVLGMRAHVVPEKRLNQLFATTQNKSATSFTFIARHFESLLREYADVKNNLVIFCDRQGGREYYGQVLGERFPEWSIEVVEETSPWSEYRMAFGDRRARLVFAERSEEQCISVALASMLSKYLREALMRRFNAYWKAHLPQIQPTAGYYNDGQRFLRDLGPKLGELGLDVSLLARSR